MTNLGMALGIKVGASIRSVLGSIFSAQNSGLVIAHALPGRRRYTAQALKGQSRETCTAIEQAILGVENINSCKVNPVTGSLTVTYSMDEDDARSFFEGLSHFLTGNHAQHEKSVIPTSMINAPYRLNDEARAARERIKDFFNHAEPLFISRIAGLAFIGYGVYRMIYGGDRPSSTQVLFWGLGLLMRQSHKDPNPLKPKIG